MNNLHLTRRRLLAGTAALPLAGTWTQLHAQSARQASLIIPFTPGGATDIFGRLYAEGMGSDSERMVVENVPGASGAIGMTKAARAPADGRTLLYTYGNLAMVSEYKVADFPKILQEFTPVIRTIVTDGLLVTGANSNFQTIKDFLDAARREPGRYTYVDYGDTVMPTLMAEAGVKLRPIPYKGGVPGMMDVMAGLVDLYAGSAAQVMPNVRSGKLRPLAISSQQRIAELPDSVPNVHQVVPTFRALNYQGVFAPKATPPAVLERVYQQSLAAIQRPAFHERAKAQHANVSPMTPAEFRSFMEADAIKIATVMKTMAGK